MNKDKCRELFLKDQGTFKEQNMQLAFTDIDKDASSRIKIKEEEQNNYWNGRN